MRGNRLAFGFIAAEVIALLAMVQMSMHPIDTRRWTGVMDVCGNGVKFSPEVCDDGNEVSGDGCAADCLSVEPNWNCDGGSPTICCQTGAGVSCSTVAPIKRCCAESGLSCVALVCVPDGSAGSSSVSSVSSSVASVSSSVASVSSSVSSVVVVAGYCGDGMVNTPSEQCDGGVCCTPDCYYRSATYVCRMAAGSCDKEEKCTGSAAFCPSDQYQSANYVCSQATQFCPQSLCTGNAISCPAVQCQTNKNPVIGCPSDVISKPLEQILLGVTATDPDAGDTVTVTISGLPSGLTANTAGSITGTISENAATGGTPFGDLDGPTQAGKRYIVTATATDSHGGRAACSFDWQVKPLLTSITGNMTCAYGTSGLQCLVRMTNNGPDTLPAGSMTMTLTDVTYIGDDSLPSVYKSDGTLLGTGGTSIGAGGVITWATGVDMPAGASMTASPQLDVGPAGGNALLRAKTPNSINGGPSDVGQTFPIDGSPTPTNKIVSPSGGVCKDDTLEYAIVVGRPGVTRVNFTDVLDACLDPSTVTGLTTGCSFNGTAVQCSLTTTTADPTQTVRFRARPKAYCPIGYVIKNMGTQSFPGTNYQDRDTNITQNTFCACGDRPSCVSGGSSVSSASSKSSTPSTSSTSSKSSTTFTSSTPSASSRSSTPSAVCKKYAYAITSPALSPPQGATIRATFYASCVQAKDISMPAFCAPVNATTIVCNGVPQNPSGSVNLWLTTSVFGTTAAEGCLAGQPTGRGFLQLDYVYADGSFVSATSMTGTYTEVPCNYQPNTNTQVCGDGKRTGTEKCDDGNTKNGDGCSAACVIERGFQCHMAFAPGGTAPVMVAQSAPRSFLGRLLAVLSFGWFGASPEQPSASLLAQVSSSNVCIQAIPVSKDRYEPSGLGSAKNLGTVGPKTIFDTLSFYPGGDKDFYWFTPAANGSVAITYDQAIEGMVSMKVFADAGFTLRLGQLLGTATHLRDQMTIPNLRAGTPYLLTIGRTDTRTTGYRLTFTQSGQTPDTAVICPCNAGYSCHAATAGSPTQCRDVRGPKCNDGSYVTVWDQSALGCVPNPGCLGRCGQCPEDLGGGSSSRSASSVASVTPSSRSSSRSSAVASSAQSLAVSSSRSSLPFSRSSVAASSVSSSRSSSVSSNPVASSASSSSIPAGPDECEAICGDGYVVAGFEECDDANTRDGDGCSAVCAVETRSSASRSSNASSRSSNSSVSSGTICGDGVRGGQEECDDGNTRDGDGCSSQCINESRHAECVNRRCISVPGNGPNLCSIDSECAQSHAVCQAMQCMGAPGPGANQCSTDPDCRGVHAECDPVHKRCIAVVGIGPDLCALDSECSQSHAVCLGADCLFAPGSGPQSCNQCIFSHLECNAAESVCDLVETVADDTCSPGSPNQCLASHAACRSRQCVSLPGLGSDECQADSQCLNVHAQCQANRCATVAGAGTDQCINDTDCGPSDDICGDGNVTGQEECDDGNTQSGDGCTSQCLQEYSHAECVNRSCVVVDGLAADACATNADCTASSSAGSQGSSQRSSQSSSRSGSLSSARSASSGGQSSGTSTRSEASQSQSSVTSGVTSSNADSADSQGSEASEQQSSGASSVFVDACGNGEADAGEECGEPGLSCSAGERCAVSDEDLQPGSARLFTVALQSTDTLACGDRVTSDVTVTGVEGGDAIHLNVGNRIEMEVDCSGGGPHLVTVTSPRQCLGPYAGPDTSEPNESAAAATSLGTVIDAVSINNQSVRAGQDQDFFSFSVSAPRVVYATVDAYPSAGTMCVQILQMIGGSLVTLNSNCTSGSRTEVSVVVNSGQTYYAHVYQQGALGATASYRLTVGDPPGQVAYCGQQSPSQPQCADGQDNDGDGFIDRADQGCDGSSDDNEQNSCLTVHAAGPDTVTVGSLLTLTLTVENTCPVAIADISVLDAFSANLAFEPADSSPSCNEQSAQQVLCRPSSCVCERVNGSSASSDSSEESSTSSQPPTQPYCCIQANDCRQYDPQFPNLTCPAGADRFPSERQCLDSCTTEESVCGNGVQEGAEECDDGNTADDDCCSSSCKVEPGCVCEAPL